MDIKNIAKIAIAGGALFFIIKSVTAKPTGEFPKKLKLWDDTLYLNGKIVDGYIVYNIPKDSEIRAMGYYMAAFYIPKGTITTPINKDPNLFKLMYYYNPEGKIWVDLIYLDGPWVGFDNYYPDGIYAIRAEKAFELRIPLS